MNEITGAALVTGASSGIGAVYADRLAARGHDLILVARRRTRLEALAERLRDAHGRVVETIAADLSDGADLRRVEARIGDAPDLGLLVNCAGSGALGPAAAVDPAEVEAMLRVNVLALTRLSLAAARRFGGAGRGTIVNIGSVLAVMTPPQGGGYSGSKAYVLSFSRSLQAELVGKGVAVQVVMPGPVRTEFFGDGPAPFPDQLFMSPETLVDTALAALDAGEAVTLPTLPDIGAWERMDTARGALAKAVMQTGRPAQRYAQPRT